jgi:hypothetical protein
MDMKLETIIKQFLLKTLDCEYKKAYIPKGWAHVKINKFSKELAKVINERGKHE